MNRCRVCNSSALSRYSYGNHLGRIDQGYIKHCIAYALLPFLRLIKHKSCDWLNMILLFSPLFPLVRCNACGYGVYDKDIAPDSLKRYYEGTYANAKGLPPEKWRDKDLYLNDPRANGQYWCVPEWIGRFAEIDALEIGAGPAFFSRLLKERFPGEAHLHVVEAGDGWEPYYREIGVSLLARFFPFETNRRFDYIHASHWLEHVYDLEDALGRLKGLLTEGGLLFIEVPNCNRDYYLLKKGDAPHIHFFTAESLCILMKKYGFKVLAVNEYGFSWPEDFTMETGPDKLDEWCRDAAAVSIRGNIPRHRGNCLRLVFTPANT